MSCPLVSSSARAAWSLTYFFVMLALLYGVPACLLLLLLLQTSRQILKCERLNLNPFQVTITAQTIYNFKPLVLVLTKRSFGGIFLTYFTKKLIRHFCYITSTKRAQNRFSTPLGTNSTVTCEKKPTWDKKISICGLVWP